MHASTKPGSTLRKTHPFRFATREVLRTLRYRAVPHSLWPATPNPQRRTLPHDTSDTRPASRFAGIQIKTSSDSERPNAAREEVC
jgi:hypothetical protein